MQIEEFIPGLEKRVNVEDPVQEDRSSQNLSEHALERMQQRGISHQAVFQTIAFGRIGRGRGATIYAIGKKEITEFAKDGIDLSQYEGVHVVMSRRGIITTVYRNSDMPRLKPRKRMPERIFRQNLRRFGAKESFGLMAYA
jgi:hypothetical protein